MTAASPTGVAEKLFAASFRGARFFLHGSDTEFGRHKSVKPIPNGNIQIIQDVGLDPRGFVLHCVVTSVTDATGQVTQSYFEARDALMLAVEQDGPGVLEHPFYGTIENCHAIGRPVIHESMNELNVGLIDITFGVSESDGRPVVDQVTTGNVVQLNAQLQSDTTTDLGDFYDVDVSDLGNYADAQTQANDFIDRVQEVSRKVAAAAENINEFAADVASFQNKINSILETPLEFAESIVGVFGSLNGLYTAATGVVPALSTGISRIVIASSATFDRFRDPLGAMKALFTFGDLDDLIPQTTHARIQRQQNRDRLNLAVQTLALGYAHEDAVQVTYGTVDEIEAEEQELDAQFDKISELVGPDMLESLLTLRAATAEFFRQEKLNAPRVITVYTHRTTCSLLSYQYYGTSEVATRLQALNNLLTQTIPDGDVLILSV